MKFLPVDVSSFRTIIEGNYVYVDKTKYIYDLYNKGERFYFLSRPRRFGKTLLISTLQELFSGNKKLFKELWIETSDWQWKQHPVVHIDFSRIAHNTPERLEQSLCNNLDKIAKNYGFKLEEELLEDKLVTLITTLSKKNGVVVLVDEYDYPILKHLDAPEKAYANREIIRNFYSTLKSLDEYLRAIFITGVSKFAKTSIFSGMNNLNDISTDAMTSQLLGYTRKELQEFFSEYFEKLAQSEQMTLTALQKKIQQWYNGYRFSPLSEIRVYNPFSIGYVLKKEFFKNYWFESGTPSFLVTLLKKQAYELQDLKTLEFDIESIGTFEIDDIPLFPLLFQTGYVTIASYDPQTKRFTLDYPNEEVRISFAKYLTTMLSYTRQSQTVTALSQMVRALNGNDVDQFCEALQSLFANIPYNLHIEQEKYFHSLLQFLGTLLNVEIQSEVVTDKGRIDLVITTKTHVYLFELKFKATPQTALAQIKRNKYYERFIIKRKKMVLIGLSFGYVKKKLNIRWKVEPLAKTK